jgi:hypothetical protein
MYEGTSAGASARVSSGHRSLDPCRARRLFRQRLGTNAALTLFNDVVQITERLNQHLMPCRSESVRTSPALWIESLDEANGLESSDCLVERPGSEPDTGKVLDVLHQAVAMLLTRCQAHENEQWHSVDQVGSPLII